MKPNGTVQYNSLSWVKSQLDAVIQDAQSSLSEYIENSADEALLQDCIEGLRLVYGTLQMVEIFGAAMLAEEMENTARAILENKVDNKEDAYDVLMRALLQLPDYLEGLQAGKRDTPMALLPLMNDMRTVCKQSLLSENVLFFPDIDAVDIEEQEIEAPVIEAGRLQAEAKRLRTHFQLGLLDLLKNNRERAGNQRMLAVIAALEKVSAEQSVRRFWSVVAALLEGLFEAGIDANVSVKMLLGNVDRHIKLLVDVGEEAFATQYSQELLKNILYYIGHSESSGERVSRVRVVYNLDELLSAAAEEADAAVGGLNAELFATVSQGIKEDLAQVKDALEIFIHSSERNAAELAPLAELLARIGDTYAMLGLNDARKSVLDQRAKIQGIIDGSIEANEDVVVAIAGALLGVEADLDNYVAQRSGVAGLGDDEDRMVPAAEYREVLSTVIRQGLQNFTDAKDAILTFTGGAGKRESLRSVLDLLEEARGVSMMLPMAQVEAMIRKLKDYVKIALIDNSHQPDEEEQDKIADVVTAIEYFFEAVLEGRPGVEAGLRAGEEALTSLVEVSDRYEPLDDTVQAGPIDAEDAEPPPTTAAADTAAHEADIVEFKQPEPGGERVAETQVQQQPASAATRAGSEYDEFEILGDDADEEILGIFIEEAGEVLDELHANLPQWRSNTDDEQALSVVRRCFHTLKGSGRLIGAQLIGEFSWKFENMLNRVIDKKIEPDSNVLKALDEAVAVLPQLIGQLKGNREPIPEVPQLMATAHALAEGAEPPSPEQETLKKKLTGTSAEAVAELELTDPFEIESVQPDREQDTLEVLEYTAQELTAEPVQGLDPDAVVAPEEFVAEDEIVLDAGEPFTLTETADAASPGEFDIDAVELPQSGEGLLATDDSGNQAADLNDIDLEEIQLDDEPGQLERSAVPEYDFEIDEGRAAEQQESELAAGMDPVLFQIYYDESVGHLDLVDALLTAHTEDGQPLTINKDLVRAFHTLHGSARTAEIDQIAELCGATEKYIKVRQEGHDLTLDDTIAALFAEVAREVRSMLEQIRSGTIPAHNKALLDTIHKAVQDELQEQLQESSKGTHIDTQAEPRPDMGEPEAPVDARTGSEAVREETAESPDPAVPEVAAEPPAEPAQPPAPPVQSTAAISYDDIDADLIDIFIEEADELIENCETLLQKLKSKPDDADSIHQLQRFMHTLKGGARMAELTPVGDLTHLLESLVIKVAEKQVSADKVLFIILNDSVDRLAEMLNHVKARAPIDTASDIIRQIEALMKGEAPERGGNAERARDDSGQLAAAQQSPATAATDDAMSAKQPEESQTATPADAGAPDAASQQADQEPHFGRRATDRPEKPHWGERASDSNYRDSQDQIRVRADLLNALVNSAGEVSIYHARMGKQMSDISFNLNELESTVVRLRQQLRNLEIETEIQIRSSFEKESDQYDDDFDPLEMDRYSTMQQLSRSLTETTSDVESIREILSEIVRDAETLLLQESRVSTELQEGLMRTRMVRFGGLSTRLRRIVRQTSRELGKEVGLEVAGDNNELDRTILDRIIAPLEHMLRNAVAHGIEPPDKRIATGKPEVGLIKIEVDRQGGDVVIRITDDGAGINAAAIRTKAIQQGLLDTDSKVSDREVLQYILRPGFSTAEKVSQVAGRGVGMDVVDTELKQLGGVLEIDTFPGKGTEFTIRLPLTLAINQALLVSAGEDVYAVPLASIEGVVRITGAELQRFYDSDQQMYSFNNVEYELKHLGQLLTGYRPDYSEQYNLNPVLLTQVGNNHYALHVDDLVGRREVVVKPVGHQLGAVRGIAGATILADGRVVLIIEMSALVVSDSLHKEPELVDEKPVEALPEKSDEKTIMVVDDSITIRKVTARMLERNGINVLLAKDGIDATNQLIDTKPDLMLLDIEMPRMDGFELATYIRNDERLKDLPIIMITSRTGEKHKEKAMEIGVNQYLGKPYQEEELLKNINMILEA